MCCVVLVQRIFTEVVDINHLKSADEQLKLPVIKNLYQIFGHNLVEPFEKSVDLR